MTDTPDTDETVTYCDWSDLPEIQCHHCHPEQRLPTKKHEDERVRPAMRVAHPVAVQAATGRHQLPTVIAVGRDEPASTHDYVQALTEPTIHYEPYEIQKRNHDGTHTFITQRHRTSSPSLLEQLESAVEASRAAEQGARAFASKPAARIDALDVLLDIEREVLTWLRRLDLPIPDHHDVATELRRAAANAGDDIYADVRSWWIRARTVTGWDSPAWRPRNTCPLCGTSGSLRVRLDAQTGVCVSCWEGWDSGTIGLLADHIRVENEDFDETTSEAG